MGTPIYDITTQVNRNPNGKLNSDIDPLELNGGDYTGRENVEFNNDGTMLSDTPSLGNKKVFDLGSQALQNQRVRIYLDELFTIVNITLKNKNNQTLGVGTGYSGLSLQSNKDAIVSVFNSFVTTNTFFNQSNTFEYIDVEIDLGYSDFILEITNQDGENVRNTIIYEAISNTGVGVFKEIGSVQLNSNTFLFSTTQDDVRTEFKPVLFTWRVGSAILVQINNHELSTNDSIIIANSNGLGAIANGEWVVTYVSDDVVALNASNGGTLPTLPTAYGGMVFLHPYGVGSIGVKVYDFNSDTYEYVKLISSKRFNFITKKQIDATGEVNNRGYLIKYTDNYNFPRTFSYDGEFVVDGALTAFNEQGFYNYNNLVDDIKNLINYTSAIVKFENQIQSGGSVPSGNWRYAVRFLTDTLSASELSFLSQPIPTFSANYTDPTDSVYGDVPSVLTTGKINRVNVTGITAGRFQFIELIGFNYGGGVANTPVVSSFRIRRVELTPQQESIILEHNGNEVDIILFDPTNSNLVRPDIIRVGSNRLIDNRLVYGNVTTSSSVDIREWVSGFKYSIKRYGLYGSFGAETFYEFFDPASTANYVGYQKWEWYRIYVAAEFYSGKLTDATFCFDVRFVSQTDYDANEFASTNITDRRDLTGDEFIDYSLGDDRNLYQLYLELKNIDWTYRIDGVLVSDLFRSVKVMRAERVKEVIADGTIVLAQNFSQPPNAPLFGEFSFSTTGSPDYDASSGTSNQTRKIASFFSPDIIFGLETYEYINGDELLNFGQLPIDSIQTAFPFPSPSVIFSSWALFGLENTATTSPQIVPISSSVFVSDGGQATISVGLFSKKHSLIFNDPIPKSISNSSYVFEFDSELTNSSSYIDKGTYYGLVFRRRLNKYGDTNAVGNTVVFTGTTILAGDSSGEVFGGDVFVQQLQYRLYRPETNPLDSPSRAYNIISSNIINVNLRAYDPNSPTLAFPVNPTLFTTWLATTTADDFTKNIGYSIFNNVQSSPTYDKNNVDRGLYPTRKYWSQNNPNNALTDRYREFLPLDFQDNPNVYGEITHLEVVQGELYTYQRNQFTREFFNTVGRLQTIEDGTVNIGNGSVLSREGLRLTNRGTNHKWSVVKGYTDSGKDTVYWFDTNRQTIMRFGSDGTQNLTERAMMTTFVRNNSRLVLNKFTPANNQGLHGVWDDIGKNYILTCRAWADSLPWAMGANYSAGDLAIYGEQYGVPIIYIASEANIDQEPSEDSRYWTRAAFSDTRYYNLWTLVFNEKKNAFSMFYSFYPRIYHVNDNRYFSPSPYLGFENDVYRHRDKDAEVLNFYGENHLGFTEYVINMYPQINKKFVAIGYNCLLKPYKVEVFSQFISQSGIDNRETYMDRDAIEMRENVAFVSIQNNLDRFGRNDEDTAPMRGLFAKVKTYFLHGENQKINDCTISFRMGQRNVSNP